MEILPDAEELFSIIVTMTVSLLSVVKKSTTAVSKHYLVEMWILLALLLVPVNLIFTTLYDSQ